LPASCRPPTQRSLFRAGRSRRIDVRTGSRHTATTAANGGYTIKVPEGTYRLEIELRSGEKLAKKPDDTRINNGDLDPGRDFTITVGSLDPRR
jgi:hypothetical protein